MRTLASRLRRMVGRDGSRCEAIQIVKRLPDERSSSFPGEIVTVRLGSAETLTLRCKYSPPDRRHPPAWHTADGHRHGVAYEGRVYGQVLEPLGMTTPRMWGTYEGKHGAGWLAIEYVDGGMQINSVPWELESAASWIAEFHIRNEMRLADPAIQFLSAYGAEYYRGWARRTLAQAWRYRRECSQIELLEETSELAIVALLEPPLTIIHGEYYPANVLWRRHAVHPIDWESAAIAAGEIDLASLTDEWPPDSIESCEAAYFRTRWPAGFDEALFARRLSAARLYMILRWAGVPDAFRRLKDRRYYLRRIGQAIDRFRHHLAQGVSVAAAG
jgi:aminoglycoside phosphotransferase (APT) family kinase protein